MTIEYRNISRNIRIKNALIIQPERSFAVQAVLFCGSLNCGIVWCDIKMYICMF